MTEHGRTHEWDDVLRASREVWMAAQHEWPWMLIGVFPAADDVGADYVPTSRDMFVYATAPAFGMNVSYWLGVASIEGRAMGHDLAGSILNNIIGAAAVDMVRPGDSIRIPLGIPDAEGNWVRDADAIFWVGMIEPNDGRRQTYQSIAEFIVPVIWSSPLGWDE